MLTTDRGVETLRGRLPAASTLLSLGDNHKPDPARAVDVLRQQGHRYILSEAGPRVFGALLAAGVIDELFLTSSSLLAGHSPNGRTFTLVEGTQLLPDIRVEGRLVSVRRHEAHLFLRYVFESGSPGVVPRHGAQERRVDRS